MTTTILFVQGGGEGTHDDWDRRLVDSLERELGAGYRVRYPRMPDEADPRYRSWRPALLDELAALEDGAILVGHSVGGAVLLHTLADDRPALRPGAVVLLAAPYIGDGGWPAGEIQPRPDLADRLPADVPVLVYHGSADATVPCAHARLHANTVPNAVVRVLPGRDHQLGDDLREVAQDLRSLAARPRRVDPRRDGV